MKAQKKYETRESVLKDIDLAQSQLISMRRRASAFKLGADNLRSVENSSEAIEIIRAEENELWKQAERIETTRLVKLKRTLAAFDTQPMFGDEQVVLQQK